MSTLQIMGTTQALRAYLKDSGIPEKQIIGGDTKVIWDSANEDEVAAARSTFDRLKAKGFNAYAVKGRDGAKGQQITAFDPAAERIIMAPAMVGG